MRTPLINGVIIRANTRCAYAVRRDDDGAIVSLSRHEAHLTNYRLRVGDKIVFRLYRASAGHWCAFDVKLLSPVGDRKLIRELPPYYALGPVIRVGGGLRSHVSITDRDKER